MDTLLPDTDNFFKYLLTIGFVLLFFAVIYPLKKEHELRIEQLENEKQNMLLKLEIKQLRDRTSEIELSHQSIQRQSDSLKQISTQVNVSVFEVERLKLRDSFQRMKVEAINLTYSLDAKNIIQNYNTLRVDELKRQIKQYVVFRGLFLIVGILFALSGFIFWTSVAYMDDMVKAGASLDNFRSYFVRCHDYLERRLLVIIIVFVLIIAIVIAAVFHVLS